MKKYRLIKKDQIIFINEKTCKEIKALNSPEFRLNGEIHKVSDIVNIEEISASNLIICLKKYIKSGRYQGTENPKKLLRIAEDIKIGLEKT